jgi:hypothetical protein
MNVIGMSFVIVLQAKQKACFKNGYSFFCSEILNRQ